MVATLWLRGLRSEDSSRARAGRTCLQIRDGKLARQDGYEDKDQALQAASPR